MQSKAFRLEGEYNPELQRVDLYCSNGSRAVALFVKNEELGDWQKWVMKMNTILRVVQGDFFQEEFTEKTPEGIIHHD